MQFKMAFPHEIHIIPTVNGGVIARCGCAELSFSTTNKLLQAMREYFKDPEAAEKAYNEARKVPEPYAAEGPRREPLSAVRGNTLGAGRVVEQMDAPDQQAEQTEESPG